MTLDRLVYERVKQATVAIALMVPRKSGAPFTIMGSGFCVDPRGLVVTCRHVHQATVHHDSWARLRATILANRPKQLDDLEAGIPHTIFYHPDVSDGNIKMFPVPVMTAVGLTDFDLAMLRLYPHTAFPNGFPYLDMLDYADVQETMPVTICGFPFGSVMHERFGTVGSSFTSGSLSSIQPIRGVPMEGVRRFQLNASATHGNSGGPVIRSDNGKVFAVLSGGPDAVAKDVPPYQGLTFAQPVWQIFRNDMIRDIMAFVPPKAREKSRVSMSSKGRPAPKKLALKKSKPKKKRSLVSRP